MGLLPPSYPSCQGKGAFLSFKGCSSVERSPEVCKGRCLQL